MQSVQVSFRNKLNEYFILSSKVKPFKTTENNVANANMFYLITTDLNLCTKSIKQSKI